MTTGLMAFPWVACRDNLSGNPGIGNAGDVIRFDPISGVPLMSYTQTHRCRGLHLLCCAGISSVKPDKVT